MRNPFRKEHPPSCPECYSLNVSIQLNLFKDDASYYLHCRNCKTDFDIYDVELVCRMGNKITEDGKGKWPILPF